MSVLTLVGDGAGAVLTVLALPLVVLLIGMPIAFVIALALRAVGLL
jgi:hypothetical protein